jgi:hypothetical protein
MLKYSPAGQLLWSRYNPSLDPTDFWFWRYKVKTDAQDNIYIGSGTATSPFVTMEFTVAKYSSSGNLLWMTRDHGSANYIDYANDIEVDGQGNVYAVGLENYTGQHCNAVVMKYGANGNILWKKVYDNSGNSGDEAFDMIRSQDGNIIVARTEDHPLVSTVSKRLSVLTKFDPAGNEQWNLVIGDTSNWYNTQKMAEDASGNIYYTGMYTRMLGHFGTAGLFVAKADASGNLQWTDTCTYYGAQWTHNDISIHPSGDVFTSLSVNDSIQYTGYHASNITVFRYGAGSVGTHETAVGNDVMNIYPNPSEGKIVIGTSLGKGTCIEVSDISGRKLECISLQQQRREIDLSHLPAGTYLVRALSDEKVITKKLVLTK